MERAPNVTWMLDGGVLRGVILAGDYCAEHEEGIGELSQICGIKEDQSIFGPARYKVTALPSDYVCFEKGRDWARLTVGCYKHQPDGRPRHMQNGGSMAEWGKRGFRILSFFEDVPRLDEIHRHLQEKNAAIWLGGAGSNPFARDGLVVHIFDRILPADARTMADTHENTHKLLEAVQATGIEERLRATQTRDGYSLRGCCWYAFAPAWTNFFKEPDYTGRTKYPVVFFLNPMDQANCNSGWFTVEELDEWIKGGGPIIKTPEQKAKELQEAQRLQGRHAR